MGNSWNFKDNLDHLGLTWPFAPDIVKLKSIQARIIIGPNGCGKSRFLDALSSTLQMNNVKKTDILYADFPEMAALERNGTNDVAQALLKEIFIDRRNTPIYDTLKLISSDPIKGVNSLVALSKTDDYCKSAVDKVNDFLKPLFGDSFELIDIADYFSTDRELSPGQRSMFYMSVMLGVLAAHHSKDEFYVLLDEPDQHLHSKAIIAFIKQLQEHLPNAKLWIATHSVHLMAHFKFDEIIYIDNGIIQKNTSLMYDKICKSMVDTEEMQQFVSFSGLYGFYEFFRECFSEPDAEGEANDKLSQIKQRIQKLGIKKILDYGAGKGRFFKLLSTIPSLEYHAFEVSPQYHDVLNTLLPSSDRIYSTEEMVPVNEFDAVLLINTLHEIPLGQWGNVFSTIKRSLKLGGYLFFCETVPLITGEFVENAGFLVLGVEEQNKLFGVTPSHLDEKQKLHFSEVPKDKIPDLTPTRLKNTLELLLHNSLVNWAREQESKNKNARNAAFYAVQHLNAEKAIEVFDKTFKSSHEPTSLIEGDGIGSVDAKAKIKVIGIGDAGVDAINLLAESHKSDVEIVAVHTSKEVLSKVPATHKLQIGKNKSTKNAEFTAGVERQFMEESRAEMTRLLDHTHMVFILADMDGCSSFGAAPIVADIARKMGILTIGIVIPAAVHIEKKSRLFPIMAGFDKLHHKVDSLIVFSFDRLMAPPTIADFLDITDILKQAIHTLVNIAISPKLVNLDFTDLKAALQNSGNAYLGVGYGNGQFKAADAATLAINNRLIDASINYATNVIVDIVGDEMILMDDVDFALDVIRGVVHPDSDIRYCVSIDEKMKDEMRLVIIATGFNSNADVKLA